MTEAREDRSSNCSEPADSAEAVGGLRGGRQKRHRSGRSGEHRVARNVASVPGREPQRLCHALGFWERNVEELELRVLLGRGDDGVCQTIVEERGEEVYVRVLVHRSDEDERWMRRDVEYDCPVRLWLDRPLGERAVIDLDTDEEPPLYTPLYLNNVPQRDHGYRPANRRRRDAEGS